MMMECGANESALDVLSRAASFVETVKMVDNASTAVAQCEEPLSKSSSTSALRSSPSPVDLRNSPSSKELPTKSHKLRRNRERRELSLSFRKDRPKKYLSEDTAVTTVNTRGDVDDDDDSSDMLTDVKTDGEEESVSVSTNQFRRGRRANGKHYMEDDVDAEHDDDDDEQRPAMADLERTTPLEEDGETAVDIENDEEDGDEDGYDSPPGTIMMMTIEDNDAPLDMTTGTRRNLLERNSASHSPPTSSSTSPPLLGHTSSPFRSNLRHLTAGPFLPSAPPPPYHPLPNSAHQAHTFHPHRLNSQQQQPLQAPPPLSSSSFLLPPPPLHPSLAATNNNNSSNSSSSSLATTLAHLQQRPSVITCASALMQQRSISLGSSSASSSPSSRSTGSHSFGRKTDGPSRNLKDRTFSDPTLAPLVTSSTFTSTGGAGKQRHGHRREISSGMCDPVIDEHFRRSLGKDYPEFLASSSSASSSSSSSSPSPSSSLPVTSANGVKPTVTANGTSNSGGQNGTSVCSSISISGMSVDDHFAKALGETWLRLQGKMAASSSCSPMSTAASSSSPPLSSSSSSSSSSGSPFPVVAGDSLPQAPPSPASSPPIHQKQRHGVVSS